MVESIASATDCRTLCQEREGCLSFGLTPFQECFMKDIDIEKTGVAFNDAGVTLGSKFCGEFCMDDTALTTLIMKIGNDDLE